ncbi:MAG: BCD family chlorophyll transporter-like MFS transporter [Cellvibrionaceae bacterium]|jgi:BCD family chlorophyll transporter-like MFS transporter
MSKTENHQAKILETAMFSWSRMLRLSSFQIGSAMGDILVTSIWNRVMISNFGMPAWPIGMLIALRYFLSPLSLWAGHRSDTTKLFGFYRTSYIWFGRGMMVMSLPFLVLSLQRLEGQTDDVLGWLYAIICFAFYGVGTLLSGSPFLALVRDSAPKVNQGFAISVAETVLIIFFAISGITFSYWMQEYDPAIFRQMVIVTMLVGGFFWCVGIWGIENQSIPPAVKDQFALGKAQIKFAPTIKRIWADPRTRLFFFFLSTATLAAWMQDVILEPFAAEVLDKSMQQTTRYNSYWQTATVITLIGGAAYWRQRAPEEQKGIAGWGLLVMALGMGFLSLESFLGGARIIETALFVFGAGFGIYTFGGLSLMAVMSSDKESGAYLGLWTISILIFKGLGNFLGSVLRDVFLAVGLTAENAYGITFLVATLGLVASVIILTRIDIVGFARDNGRYKTTPEEVQAAGVEL